MATQPLSQSVKRTTISGGGSIHSSRHSSSDQWWAADGIPASLSAEERGLVDALRAEADVERRRWAEEIVSLQERLRNLERKNKSRLSDINSASLQELSQYHDETLRVAFEAAPLMELSNVLLGALGRVQANATVRIARLEKRILLTSFWKRRQLKQELNSLREAKAALVDSDLGVVQRERQLVVEAVGQLHVQADDFREALRRRCGGALLKWERQRETWIETGMDNWQRAQNGLRLRPLPPLKAGNVKVRVKGIVQQYNALRRQGVIRPEDGGPDVLVTRSSLQNANLLHPGQRVGFIIRQTDVGPWAQDVIVMRTT